jgi:hypothetical protein
VPPKEKPITDCRLLSIFYKENFVMQIQRRLRLSNSWLWLFLILLTLSLIGANRTATADSGTSDAQRIPVIVTDDSNANDCLNTSTGLLPLTDMARIVYKGFPGGLYPGGNYLPNLHLQSGMGASHEIEPLNTQGQPDSSGKIVFLSVGMSNTKQGFQQFIKIARDEKDRSVARVNGAQGGYDAARIADPTSDYWSKIDNNFSKKGLSPLQVQVIWLMQAVANETTPFPQSAQELQSYLRDIVLIVENRYPNVKTIYLSSRAYGGYAGASSPSTEPWAYEGAFAVKWLIESQINVSDPALAYDNTPWLAWGPYTWADGLNPRSDGLIWKCEDFESDGTHPSPSGELKMANMLLNFFSNDPTTQWFPN